MRLVWTSILLCLHWPVLAQHTHALAHTERLPLVDRENVARVQQFAQQTVNRFEASLPSGAALQPTSTHRIGNLWHTSFTLSYVGIPVREAWVTTDIGASSGTVLNTSQHLVSSAPNALSAKLPGSMIHGHLNSYLGIDSVLEIYSASPPKLVFIASQSMRRLRLCYEVTVHQFGHEWRLTIDAMTGTLVEKKEMLEFVGGEQPQPLRTAKGLVRALIHRNTPFDAFDTLPMAFARVNIFDNSGKKLIGETVTDSLGFWTATVPFGSFVKSQFAGPYQHVIRHDDDDHSADTAWFGFSDTLTWLDNNSNAAERDAYYHVSVARAYAKQIDTALGAVDSPLTIHVNLNLGCNAFYSPDSLSLNFFHSSTKCSNTGEIADIIYHEFGHRVAHIRYAGSANGNLVNYTLGEGFADIYSAFLRDDPRIAIGMFAGEPFKYLRSCENQMKYPDSISADPHVSGKIISGAFWDLRKAIGLAAAEHIFSGVEWLHPDAPDETSPAILKQAFLEVLRDALLVDDDDNDLFNGTPHSKEILSAFAKHGITLGQFIHLAPETLDDQSASSGGFAVRLQESYSGPMDGIDASSIILHYSTDGKHYDTVMFEPLHDSTFQAIIPQQEAGAIVSYYASAHLVLDTASVAYWPSPTLPLRFTVGYEARYFDDCETDRGWSLRDASDNAVRGLWTRGVPNGTYSIPSVHVQQDTDHTAQGTMCYVTGNANNPDIDVDDVDSGATTLTTNAIDLSNYNAPVLRYWYYYSNDQGDHPGEPQWLVEISGDDGVHWKEVQRSDESTEGWTSNLVRVSDYVTPSGSVKLRFTASDYAGAIVEAGVDDIEALSSPEGTSSMVLQSEAPNLGIIAVHPNPATSQQITIDYSIPASEHVTLDIRNIFGERVGVLEDRMLASGAYRAQCARLAAGTYWIVLRTPDNRSLRRLVIQ